MLEDYRPYLMARARSEHALNMAIYEQHPQEELRAAFEALEEKRLLLESSWPLYVVF